MIDEYLKLAEKCVDSLDEKGNYFIHHAVQSNNVKAVEQLMKLKWWQEHVDVRNSQLKTGLMLASQQGNLNIVKILLNSGANPNKADINQFNSFHYAIMSTNKLSIFSMLLPLMRDVNKCNRKNISPLMLAAAQSKFKEIKRLIDAGAKVSQTNTDGMQAIHYAALKGSFECLKILADAGADINAVMKRS